MYHMTLLSTASMLTSAVLSVPTDTTGPPGIVATAASTATTTPATTTPAPPADRHPAADQAIDRSTAPVVTFSRGASQASATTVRWNGVSTVPDDSTAFTLVATITPRHDGRHTFGVGGSDGVEVAVDGHRTAAPVVLQGGHPVEVRLTVDDPEPGATTEPWWSHPGIDEQEPIPASSISAPTTRTSARAGTTCSGSGSGDRDGDLVPDALETGGYTVVSGSLVPWRDELGAAGHRRYVSDPNSCRTAKDPYTDLEKVFGVMPGGSRREAQDPLVAAAPVIGVDLEKLHLTLNDVTGDATSRTKSFSTTNSWSRTLGGKVGVEQGGEMTDDGVKASTKVSSEFNFSYSRSGSVTEGTSTTWQEMTTRSTAKAASLNGNVRYHNAGTAPIFDAHPTTSWVLQGEHTMASFRAGPNFRADAIGANETYPARNAAALSVETINDAGTVDLTVDAAELAALGRQGEVTLDTPQTSGTYGRVVDGRLDPAAGAWGPVLAGIRQASATIILDAGTEVTERQVAVPDVRDANDTTPRMTLGEAIDRAFGAEHRGGHRYYRSPTASDPSHTAPLLLDERAVLLTMDPATARLVDEQSADGRTPYQVELRRGMHVGVKTAAHFDDFSSPTFAGWSGHDGRSTGVVRPSGTASHPTWTKSGLTAGNRYRIVYRTARPDSGSATSTWLRGGGVQLDLAERNWGSGWALRAVEFTAPTDTVVLTGRGRFDDLAFFDLGAGRRADVSWVSRHGADLALADTTRPSPGSATLTTPVDLQDRGGSTALDLLVSRGGKPVDLRRADVTVTGGAVGPWATNATYKERGHVNLPIRATGNAVVTVYEPRNATTSGCDNCREPIAIIPITVGASRPATVDFWYREGSSRHMCTFRIRELETPGYRGDLTHAADFRGSWNSCRNDDAYYLSFRNLPVGSEISVFDDPSGKRDDDFFVWETKVESSAGLLRASPRENPAGVTVQERYDDNGLVGKISRFELRYPGTW